MKTYTASAHDINRRWYLVDASGKTLGRLASDVARVLRGKHRRDYSPNLDLSDFVIVVNAEKIRVSGRKMTDKIYYRHSGYPGGLRSESLGELLARRPERVIELAVKGMLPNNSLGDSIYRKLKVYAGPKHPHEAQKPVSFEQVPGTKSVPAGDKE